MKYTVSSVISLISRLHTSTADFTNKRLSELSENESFVSSHGFILFQLANEEKLTMGEISRRINRDKSTTTVLVKKLKAEGFIKEEQSQTDSRVKYISLTEKGREYNKFTSGISHDLLSSFYKGFSPEEKKELLRLLEKAQSNLDNSLK